MKARHPLNFISIIFSISLFYMPSISWADFEESSFDSHSQVLTLPVLTVDNQEWLQDVQLFLNLATGQFSVLGGTPIGHVASDEGLAMFNVATQLLTIPVLSVDGEQWFGDVQLQFDFAAGQFAIINAISIAAPVNDILGGCSDNIPQPACTATNMVGLGVTTQFVEGASCSSTFPQYDYVPLDLSSTQGLCGVAFPCGACASSYSQ